jgi:hypothetical protein
VLSIQGNSSTIFIRSWKQVDILWFKSCRRLHHIRTQAFIQYLRSYFAHVRRPKALISKLLDGFFISARLPGGAKNTRLKASRLVLTSLGEWVSEGYSLGKR